MNMTCTFNQDGALINIGEWDSMLGPDDDGLLVERNPLPEGAYAEEREVFQRADGGLCLQLDPLQEAERFVVSHFSSLQLLQMKAWKDDLAEQNTPKLSATYSWTTNIVRDAAFGQTQFAPPPYTFAEIIEECAPLL